MKQAALTGAITAVIIIAFFFGYKYYTDKKEVEAYIQAHLETSISEELTKTERLAEGTAFNIDSLKRRVNDTLTVGYEKLGVLIGAQDTIKMKFIKSK